MEMYLIYWNIMSFRLRFCQNFKNFQSEIFCLFCHFSLIDNLTNLWHTSMLMMMGMMVVMAVTIIVMMAAIFFFMAMVMLMVRTMSAFFFLRKNMFLRMPTAMLWFFPMFMRMVMCMSMKITHIVVVIFMCSIQNHIKITGINP